MPEPVGSRNQSEFAGGSKRLDSFVGGSLRPSHRRQEMTLASRTRDHIRRHVVGYLALFVALGGTGAWAADKITSKDIAKNAVRSKHIKAGQVKAADANLVRHVRRPESVETGPLTPVIRVKANRGDLLGIHGRVELRKVAGVYFCYVELHIQGPIEQTGTVISTSSFDPVSAYIGTDDGQDLIGARPITVPVVEQGTYRVHLTGAGEGGASCEFRDRNLFVELIR